MSKTKFMHLIILTIMLVFSIDAYSSETRQDRLSPNDFSTLNLGLQLDYMESVKNDNILHNNTYDIIIRTQLNEKVHSTRTSAENINLSLAFDEKRSTGINNIMMDEEAKIHKFKQPPIDKPFHNHIESPKIHLKINLENPK